MKSSRQQRLDELFDRYDAYVKARNPYEVGRIGAELMIAQMVGARQRPVSTVFSLRGVPVSARKNPPRSEVSFKDGFRQVLQAQIAGAHAAVQAYQPQVPKGRDPSFTTSGDLATYYTPLGAALVRRVPLVFLERRVRYPDVLKHIDPDYQPDEDERKLPVIDIDIIAAHAAATKEDVSREYPSVTADRMAGLIEAAHKEGLLAA